MTTDKDKMPKRYTGVHRRSGSSIWQWRLKVPSELRSLYTTEWAHRCTLDTSDLREANRKAMQLHASWLAKFDEQQRRLEPTKLDDISNTQARQLADEIQRAILQEDEQRRTSPNKWPRFGKATIARQLRGMPSDLVQTVREYNIDLLALYSQAMAAGKIGEALPDMERAAARLGWKFSAETPGFAEALRTCLAACREAYALAAKRDSGEVIPTPTTAQNTESRGHLVYLRDVFDRWKVSKPRGQDAVRACERALKLFEQQTGNPPIDQVRRQHGDAFRAWLQTLGTASKTARDRLTYVKSLLGYASQDLDVLAKNPWRGLDMPHKTETRRAPWTSEQLQSLFSLPLFTKYELPTDWKAGADAAYWIPLMLLYTGARAGEICQLQTSDVHNGSKGPFIRISDSEEGASVKTESSIRDVPLHSELIRLGFLDYVQHVRDQGVQRLWPQLKFRPVKPAGFKPSGYFSAWFGDLRKTFDMELPDLHSFRHTVRTALTEAGVPDAVQDRITGHKVRGSIGSTTYTHPVSILRTAVETLKFDELRLRRVFRVKRM